MFAVKKPFIFCRKCMTHAKNPFNTQPHCYTSFVLFQIHWTEIHARIQWAWTEEPKDFHSTNDSDCNSPRGPLLDVIPGWACLFHLGGQWMYRVILGMLNQNGSLLSLALELIKCFFVNFRKTFLETYLKVRPESLVEEDLNWIRCSANWQFERSWQTEPLSKPHKSKLSFGQHCWDIWYKVQLHPQMGSGWTRFMIWNSGLVFRSRCFSVRRRQDMWGLSLSLWGARGSLRLTLGSQCLWGKTTGAPI